MFSPNTIPFKLLVPVMTMERYAQETGLRFYQVRTQAEVGNLPTIKIGGLRLVNIVRASWELWQTDGAINMTVSEIHHEHFANLVGLKENSVKNQIRNNNLPGKQIGRLTMVDLGELFRICAQIPDKDC